jgi:hypothetical protein
MPKVADLPRKIVIRQFYGDHPPPHSHAEQGDDEVLLRIDDLSIYKGSLSTRSLATVRAWAHLRRNKLLKNWEAAEAGQPIREITSP